MIPFFGTSLLIEMKATIILINYYQLSCRLPMIIYALLVQIQPKGVNGVNRIATKGEKYY